MRIRATLLLASLGLLSCKTAPEGAEVKDSQAVNAKTTNEVTRDQFFDQTKMYYLRVKKWDANRMTPQSLADWQEVPGAELEVFATDAHSPLQCPDKIATPQQRIFDNAAFKIRTSGHSTKGTNKASFQFKFKDAKLAKMSTLSLKSMWNDPSQLREALAWKLFQRMNVPASGHTWAKLCINDRYFGLYSIIEVVDESYLSARFKSNDKGNLFKANVASKDVGAADLSFKPSANPQNPGEPYTKSPVEQRTYELKTNSQDQASGTYHDLAALIAAVNGADTAQTDKEKYFKSQEYVNNLSRVFHWREFLRWAAVNALLGAWDNYWAKPSNYFLYNAGFKDDPRAFMTKPFFVWLPWDYDNSLGISYWPTKWQYADIVFWAASTKTYNGGNTTTYIPLIQNMMKNDTFLNYYLDAVEYALDNYFNVEKIQAQRKILWDHIRTAAFLESDFPDCRNTGPFPCAHTGRQFSNHEVFLQAEAQNQLDRGNNTIEGIEHYVRMRHDSARDQLANLRKKRPKGSSGADFNKPEAWIP